METVVITATKRKAGGRRANQYLRANGHVPAVIYGHKLDPTPISLPKHDLRVALERGAHLLEIDIEGNKETVLVKDVQRDYLGVDVLHVDLTRVDLTELVQVRVPIEYKGEPVGVHEGGQLEHHLMELEIECQTAKIPASIRVRVDALKLSESLYVRDVQTEPGVKIITSAEDVICTVRPPVTAAAVAVEGEAAEEEETAEPEVISRGKEEAEAG